MDTRSRGFRYALAALLVLSCATRAFAQPSGREQGKKWGAGKDKFDSVIKELNLTPEQQQKIADQRTQEKEQAQAIQQKLAATRSRLHQELEQASPDKAKVYSLLGEMKELTGKRMEQRVERIFSLKEILTPEQFKTLQQKTGGPESNKEGRHEKGSRDGACRGKHGNWDTNA